MTAPTLYVHHVSRDGGVSLVAANVPYSNLQWSRSASTCGSFEAQLACPLPFGWPGRYLVTVDGRDEVGVVEKVEATEDGSTPVTVSGRFAECLWDRYRMGVPTSVSGATWRQALTAAMLSWHMGDLPPIDLGEGCEGPSGSSYAISGEGATSAMDLIYETARLNDSRPLLAYDWGGSPGRMTAMIVAGRDLTRAQSELPWVVFSLSLGTALRTGYSGDYSTACSVVLASASDSSGDEGATIVETVAVGSFDADSMWEQRAYEDVGSLIDTSDGSSPTPGQVREAGRLRTYDHEAALSVDCSVAAAGYRDGWDLGDTCEVEVPSIGVVAVERIEGVREVHKPEGSTVEVTLGTKQISRVARALIGRR